MVWGGQREHENHLRSMAAGNMSLLAHFLVDQRAEYGPTYKIPEPRPTAIHSLQLDPHLPMVPQSLETGTSCVPTIQTHKPEVGMLHPNQEEMFRAGIANAHAKFLLQNTVLAI